MDKPIKQNKARTINRPDATHKNCVDCGLYLSLDKFHKQNSSADGHMNMCKKCRGISRIRKKLRIKSR